MPRGCQRLPISLQAPDAGGELRAGDVRDPAAAALDQVLGGQAADRLVVGADVGRLRLRKRRSIRT